MKINDLRNRFANSLIEIAIRSDESSYITSLIDRDMPAQAVVKEYTCESLKGQTYYTCPKCEKSISTYDNFCAKCGQRIDRENVAL